MSFHIYQPTYQLLFTKHSDKIIYQFVSLVRDVIRVGTGPNRVRITRKSNKGNCMNWKPNQITNTGLVWLLPE